MTIGVLALVGVTPDRGGRLGKIELRLGNPRPERGGRVELERPLGREVVVQGTQGGGRALHQEVLGFGGVRETAVLFRQEASGHEGVQQEPQTRGAHPDGFGQLHGGQGPAV
jgi:hypothetical protein